VSDSAVGLVAADGGSMSLDERSDGMVTHVNGDVANFGLLGPRT
jgi:hypothetical protein